MEINEINNNSIIGTRVGIFDILYECNYKTNDGHRLFHVKCSKCGFENDMVMFQIKQAKLCRHLRANGRYIPFGTKWDNQRLRAIFSKMLNRCYNKNNKDYVFYGANGITVCDEWIMKPKSFEEWALNNGYADDLTIDRINSFDGYNPLNCRWVTRKENSKYKSTTRIICVDGVCHTGMEWANILNVGQNIINTMVREHGENTTKEFIRQRLKNPTLKLQRGSWLKTYNIL